MALRRVDCCMFCDDKQKLILTEEEGLKSPTKLPPNTMEKRLQVAILTTAAQQLYSQECRRRNTNDIDARQRSTPSIYSLLWCTISNLLLNVRLDTDIYFNPTAVARKIGIYPVRGLCGRCSGKQRSSYVVLSIIYCRGWWLCLMWCVYVFMCFSYVFFVLVLC